MFGRRRRPVLGAAAVGGAGYALGKRRANLEEDEAGEVDEAEEVDAAAPAEEPGLGDDSIDALEKLGGLKERGLLTQQEFDEQKARILDAP
jgi:hypothetical protein